MSSFEKTIETEKSFDQAVAAVETKTTEKGFRVLHTHDIAGALAEKGFRREPMKIVEICNAKYAHQVIEQDVRAALMLPCPIVVYVQNGKTFLSTMLPSAISDFFPGRAMEGVAGEVEKAVLQILTEAAA